MDGAASPRKAISRTLRFEVFKRDSFRCQYCGGKAPDVLLEVDHIRPVSDGGTDDVLNLVTACESCNAGKGSRPLSANVAASRAHAEAERLQQRREEMELMMRWMEELRDFNRTIVDRLCCYWNELAPGVGFSADDERALRRLIRRHSIDVICAAMDLAADRIEYDDNGNATIRSWIEAFDRIPASCRAIKARKMARKST